MLENLNRALDLYDYIVLLVDMRSTKELSDNHVETVVYHHWFAVHSRASCRRDAHEQKSH